MRGRRIIAALACVVAAGCAALVPASGIGARGGNMLVNPSFEDGPEPWWSFHEEKPWVWGDFEVTTDHARTGERSARLVMDSDESRLKARVYGAVQEITPDHCPGYLSGWYRVEGWERGTEKQYIQVVVIVWRPDEEPEGMNWGNYQVAYTMAGVTENPLPDIANRAFVVTGPKDPVEGEWVFFELELAEAFREKWGMTPENFEYLRVLFEVRYDDRRGEEFARGDVYFDDLYLGDESRAHQDAGGAIPGE